MDGFGSELSEDEDEGAYGLDEVSSDVEIDADEFDGMDEDDEGYVRVILLRDPHT
jgi:hypothetical protein